MSRIFFDTNLFIYLLEDIGNVELECEKLSSVCRSVMMSC
jgi:hypothetical protein